MALLLLLQLLLAAVRAVQGLLAVGAHTRIKPSVFHSGGALSIAMLGTLGNALGFKVRGVAVRATGDRKDGGRSSRRRHGGGDKKRRRRERLRGGGVE